VAVALGAAVVRGGALGERAGARVSGSSFSGWGAGVTAGEIVAGVSEMDAECGVRSAKESTATATTTR